MSAFDGREFDFKSRIPPNYRDKYACDIWAMIWTIMPGYHAWAIATIWSEINSNVELHQRNLGPSMKIITQRFIELHIFAVRTSTAISFIERYFYISTNDFIFHVKKIYVVIKIRWGSRHDRRRGKIVMEIPAWQNIVSQEIQTQIHMHHIYLSHSYSPNMLSLTQIIINECCQTLQDQDA